MVPEESETAINKVVSRETLVVRSVNCGHSSPNQENYNLCSIIRTTAITYITSEPLQNI
jgi:hypothetical protein